MTHFSRAVSSCATAVAATMLLTSCTQVGEPTPARQGAGTISADVPLTPGQIGGRVVSDAGDPVFGVRVALGGKDTVSDSDGRFVLPRPERDGLLLVGTGGGYGYSPVDAQTSEKLEVTVHPVLPARTVRVAGEVRTGRSLLPRSADLAAYVDALSHVSPLLAGAGSSAVTLASPVVPDPWQRGVDASAPLLTEALAVSGVDLLNLATDRIADAGPAGVISTLDSIESAGLSSVGAGADIDDAWSPAVLDVGGRQIAFVACQVGPADSAWAATEQAPGAAACDLDRLRDGVERAAGRSDAVVLFVRSDLSSNRRSTVSRQVRAAVEAGATVVVGAGGPFASRAWDAGGADAGFGSLGDLLTDDLAVTARDGALLRVGLGQGRTTFVGVEPLTRNAGIPSPVGGALAGAISRVAAAVDGGRLVLARDQAVDGRDGWTVEQATSPAPSVGGVPPALDDGWWVPTAGEPGVTVGHDLTPTGTFEDDDADPATAGALGWLLSPDAELVRDDGQQEVACEGELAVRLAPRGPNAASVTSASPTPLPDTTGVSVYASVRDVGEAELRGRLVVQWFDGDTAVGEDSVPLEELDTTCQVLRVETVPPPSADSFRSVVLVRGGEATVDDLHVVAWQGGEQGGRRYSHLRVFEPAQVTLVADVPEGAATPPGPFRAAGGG